MLEPPYANRLERPLVTAETAAAPDQPPLVVERNAAKKALDEKLFGTRFF